MTLLNPGRIAQEEGITTLLTIGWNMLTRPVLRQRILSMRETLFGVLLALKNQPNNAVIIGLAAIVGIFHGYAYGEAIVGAEMRPLVAYLLGFSFIQVAIAAAAYWVGQNVSAKAAESPGSPLRFAGFVICGVGGAFLF